MSFDGSRVTTPRPRDVPLVPLCATVILAFRLALALLLIPPWQNPDEPQHVRNAAFIALYGTDRIPNVFDARIEGAIVRSMAEHDWWRHYGRPTPDPIPPTFQGIESVESASLTGPVGYYVSIAEVFTRLRVSDVVAQMYAMRILSLFGGLAALWCAWAATRLLFGPLASAVVASLLALHPQFAIVSTTAGPDAVANLAGAAAWWQGARAIRSRTPLLSTLAMFAAVVAAVATLRLAVPLIGLGVACLAVAVARNPGRVRSVVLGAGILASGALASGVMLHEGLRAHATVAFTHAVVPFLAALTSPPPGWRSFLTFLEMLAGTWWLSAGWLRYQPPPGLLTALNALIVLALAGTVSAWHRRQADRLLISLCLTVVSLQFAAVVVLLFMNRVGPQGRYMFPVMAPALSLLWIGVSTWVPPARRHAVAVAMVTIMAAFDIVGWYGVLAPAYV